MHTTSNKAAVTAAGETITPIEKAHVRGGPKSGTETDIARLYRRHSSGSIEEAFNKVSKSTSTFWRDPVHVLLDAAALARDGDIDGAFTATSYALKNLRRRLK